MCLAMRSWLKFSFLETGCLKFHSFSFLFFGPPVHLSTRRVTKAQDRTSATENPPSIAISRVLVVSYDKPPLFQQEASHLFADLPAGQRRERSGAAAMARPSRLYLIAYNSLQSLGWSLALFRLLACLAPPVSLHPAYALAGDLICFLQTCAVLETVHAAVGLVPTSPFLAFLQWGGRTHFVLALLRQIPEIQGSPSVFITFMAWSISEVIRYSHYALTSLKVCPAWLTYLRYTAFIPLYPIGVGPGEMWTIYQALPFVKERDLYSAFFAKFSISYHSFLVGGLLCYPLLWLKLYLHVFKQRKSKLGKADRKKKRA